MEFGFENLMGFSKPSIPSKIAQIYPKKINMRSNSVGKSSNFYCGFLKRLHFFKNPQ